MFDSIFETLKSSAPRPNLMQVIIPELKWQGTGRYLESPTKREKAFRIAMSQLRGPTSPLSSNDAQTTSLKQTPGFLIDPAISAIASDVEGADE